MRYIKARYYLHVEYADDQPGLCPWAEVPIQNPRTALAQVMALRLQTERPVRRAWVERMIYGNIRPPEYERVLDMWVSAPPVRPHAFLPYKASCNYIIGSCDHD